MLLAVWKGLNGGRESIFDGVHVESREVGILWEYADARSRIQDDNRRDLRIEANWLGQQSSVTETLKVRSNIARGERRSKRVRGKGILVCVLRELCGWIVLLCPIGQASEIWMWLIPHVFGGVDIELTILRPQLVVHPL